MEMLTVKNLLPVGITASLIGFALVSQGLYWLERFGEIEEVRSLLTSLLIQEIAPIFVSFLTLGRGGLILLGEVGQLSGTRQLRALDRQGIDPFLLLIVPRSAAIIIALFCHVIVFIMVAFVTGYLGALSVGVTSVSFPAFVIGLLESLGRTGFLAVPVKSFFLGLTISVVCSLSALELAERGEFTPRSMASGLIRALSALLIVSSLLTILL
jgi:phospholipid/cholesterol/gamma-HCH transport system permease protein